jgi:hypothetical protein
MGNNESTPDGGNIDSQFSSPNAQSNQFQAQDFGYNFNDLSFPLIKTGTVTHEHMNEAYSKLPDVQRVMIHKVTKNLTQIMLENHRSLTLLFSFLQSIREMDTVQKNTYSPGHVMETPPINSPFRKSNNFVELPKLLKNRLEELDEAGEFTLWLADLNKHVFSFKEDLQSYRQTLINILGIK